MSSGEEENSTMNAARNDETLQEPGSEPHSNGTHETASKLDETLDSCEDMLQTFSSSPWGRAIMMMRWALLLW